MVDREAKTPRQSQGTLGMAEAWVDIARDHADRLIELERALMKPGPRMNIQRALEAKRASHLATAYEVQFRSWATRPPPPEARNRIGAEWRNFLYRAKAILAAG